MKYKTLALFVLLLSLAALIYGYLRPGLHAVEDGKDVVIREGAAMIHAAQGTIKRDANGQRIISPKPEDGAAHCPT